MKVKTNQKLPKRVGLLHKYLKKETLNFKKKRLKRKRTLYTKLYINIYIPNNRPSKYTKQKLTDVKDRQY